MEDSDHPRYLIQPPGRPLFSPLNLKKEGSIIMFFIKKKRFCFFKQGEGMKKVIARDFGCKRKAGKI
jgi:hypothetical protein